MADAIVHIGFNKCGSTAIQKWLADNSASLREYGIEHQRSDPRPHEVCANPHYHVLACTLAGLVLPSSPITKVLGIEKGDRAAQDRIALNFKESIESSACSGDYETLVVSSEYLTARYLPVQAIEALGNWFKSLFSNVTYVAYVRKTHEWLTSLYAHEARRGATEETLDEFARRVRCTRFGQMLQYWEAAKGENMPLHVHLFREEWLSGSGLIQDFVQHLDIPQALSEKPAQQINTYFDRSIGPLDKLAWPIKKRPQSRAQMAPDTRDLIQTLNADDWKWIENKYYAKRRVGFRAWADLNTA